MHEKSPAAPRRYILYYSVFPLFLLVDYRPYRLYPNYHVSPLTVSFISALYTGSLYTIPQLFTTPASQPEPILLHL